MPTKRDLRATLVGSHDRVGEWGREHAAALVGLHPFEVNPTDGVALPAPHEDGNLDTLTVGDTNAIYLFNNAAAVTVTSVRPGRYAGQLLVLAPQDASVTVLGYTLGAGDKLFLIAGVDLQWTVASAGGVGPFGYMTNTVNNTINSPTPLEFTTWAPLAATLRGGMLAQIDGFVVPVDGLYRVTMFLGQVSFLQRSAVINVLGVDGVASAPFFTPTGATGYIRSVSGHNASNAAIANLPVQLTAGQRVGMFTQAEALAGVVAAVAGSSFLLVEKIR